MRKRRVYFRKSQKREIAEMYRLKKMSVIDLALKTGATVRTIYNIISKY